MKKIFLMLILVLSNIHIASANDVMPEDIVETNGGMRMARSVAEKINKYNISHRVSDLYNQDIKLKNGMNTISEDDRNCIVLFINVEGDSKFIEQMHTKGNCFK